MRQAFIGVDVGTTSTRAGIFDEGGNLLATARHPITVWHEAGDVVEQSSSDIWAACAEAVRGAMAEAAISPDAVKGIGFDATCSLVVLDRSAAILRAASIARPRLMRDFTVPMGTRRASEISSYVRSLTSRKTTACR